MKRLLNNLYYGDQTSAVSTQVSGVLEFRRPSTMSLREYTTEMRTRFQQLDARGEVIPVLTRGHILLNNAQLTSEQKGLLMATTQRNMTFNITADAVCLLFTELKPALRLPPRHSYYGSTENRGKGGKGGKGDKPKFQSECWNCGITDHRSNDC